MTKSSGPRTEPWGTPQEEVCQDRSVSHFTQICYNKLGLSKYNRQGLLSFCLLFFCRSVDLNTSVPPEINERSSMRSRDKEANLYLLSLHYVLLDSAKRTSVTFNAAEPADKSGACKSPESITIKRCKNLRSFYFQEILSLCVCTDRANLRSAVRCDGNWRLNYELRNS